MSVLNLVREFVRRSRYLKDFDIVQDAEAASVQVNVREKVLYIPPDSWFYKRAEVLGTDVRTVVEIALEHEEQHVKFYNIEKEKCPDVLTKLHDNVISIVEDLLIDLRELPTWKRVFRKYVYELTRLETLLKGDLDTMLKECRREGPSKCANYLMALQLLSERDIYELDLVGTVHEKIWREIKEVSSSAFRDICEGLRKLAEVCEKYGLRCAS